LRDAHYLARFGEARFFRRTEHALEYAWNKLEEGHKETCPLHISVPLAAREAKPEASSAE
jgi:hypothetical protein